jgi:hypothetical protein
MPSTKEIAIKPPAITRPQGEPLFRMGAPPVPGSAVTAGKCVAVGAADVAVGSQTWLSEPEFGLVALMLRGVKPAYPLWIGR